MNFPSARCCLAAVILAAGCGSAAGPSASPLPFAFESAHFRFFYSAGDSVQASRQEAFHEWAVARLGVAVPRKIDYRKYASRQDMGARTGQFNANAYAEPETFTVHTLFEWDNHETVHLYTALVGRPSDFFNEGIAVAFQVDPASNDFEPRFNGAPLHDAARSYHAGGSLVLPLSGAVTTSGFRAIADATLSYREAGSFVAFLIDRYGMERVIAFFRASGRDDALETIRARFLGAFDITLEDAERVWLAFVG